METFPPGRMAAWGLGYESLAQEHPGVIVASITWYGQTGPCRDYEGDELIAFARGGAMALSGEPGGPPCVAPGELACGMASMHAALAAQVALWDRLDSGLGQHIDVSVTEAAAHVGGYTVPFYSVNHQKPVRVGYAEPSFEFHDVYPCKDGGVRFFINPREHWRAFVDWLGGPEAIADPIFEDREVRNENRDLINPYVVELSKQYTKREIYLEGQRRHLPVSPMCTAADFVESEQTKARELFVEIQHPVVGSYGQVRALHRYSESVPPHPFAAPLVGQHNEEILVDEFGLSREELVRLQSAGVI